MSKNLTRKGIAFGAIVALGTTLFAGAPASAAGIDNGSVSLAPTAGAEYDIIAGGNLALKANSASGVTGSGKYLKFQVEDAAVKTSVKYASSTQYSVATTAYVNNADVSTVTVASHKFKVGDKVTVTTTAGAVSGVDGTAVVTATTSTTVSYAETATVSNISSVTTAGTIALVASTPSAGKYIYDTKLDTNSSDKTISLQSSDEDVTQTVTVTAWIDDNDNGAIDTTEYQSPARTVRFLKHSEVTPTVAFNPIAVGSDSTVVATVTFSPVLNGSQLANADNRSSAAGAVKVNFTRPGSSKSIVSASTSYSNTTKQWTVTSVDLNSTGATDTDGGTGGWAITQPNATNLFTGSISITKDVVTATTSATGSRSTPAAHGLQVGDLITIASSTTARADITVATKVLSVPTTTTFTYAAAATGVDLAATAQAAGAITVTKILRNYAVAGTYTAQALLYKDAATNALTALGAAASSAGVAVTASSATIESVASATVSATASNAASVYTGTKTAAFVGKVLDADGAAVGAGLDAVITATTVSSAGTVKINGTTVVTGTVLYAKTDANGQVAISVENSSALAGEAVVLDLDIQGVDAADVTATWANKVYSIVDLNDSSAVASAARTRAVAEGASYTFDLLVQDQFKAPAGADIRLKAVATGNTVFTNTLALTAGKATLAIADGGLTTGDVTVALSFQTLSAGIWSDVDADTSNSTTYVSWNEVSDTDEDLARVAIKYYTQTDAVTLNANGANYPSTATADFTGATTTEALVAVDSRVSNAAAALVVAAGKAVVSGAVTNASTGASKSGQVVTISAAGLLFKSGDVWSIGSASQIAADGTFAFDVYSANPGDITVTVAAGSVTKTAKLTFTGASTSAKKLTVTPGSTTYVPGQTVVYTIKLTDGNGNAVDTVAPAATPAAAYITVTYAGPGVISGSLPVETDASGEATVRIATGVADSAAAVLTVKYDQNFDGDVADTNDLTVSSSVAASNPAASIATLTVTAATTSQAGRAVDVTVKAVDAAGAAVAGATVALSSVGAGSLASSSVVTNASGVATVKLVAGASDLGSAVVTATANAKSGSATVEFGATDATVDIIGKRVYVTTEFAAGKRVTIYDNGVRRYSAIQTSDAEKVVMWNVKSGSHTIVVKISGASSDTVTFLVK